MANITWTPPNGWVETTGAHVSFTAPCDCASAGNLIIGSNVYSIVDANGVVATGAFVLGAIVEFILDCENNKAYIENAGALSEADYKAHNTYSTVEHWTGGYWIDGRKIYEKTLVCNITKIGVSEFSWGINNFSSAVGCELIGKESGGNFRDVPLISTSPAWFITINYLYYSGKLTLQTQQAIITPTVYATLRYTCTNR